MLTRCRHEIAFVFGQLLSPDSIPYLVKVLNDTTEAPVVRHEAAEALGGIATPEVLPHLKTWSERKDSPDVLKDSCVVALDMYEVCLVFIFELSTTSHLIYHHSTRTRVSSNMLMAWARVLQSPHEFYGAVKSSKSVRCRCNSGQVLLEHHSTAGCISILSVFFILCIKVFSRPPGGHLMKRKPQHCGKSGPLDHLSSVDTPIPHADERSMCRRGMS